MLTQAKADTHPPAVGLGWRTVSSRARLLLWLESCFQKEGWSFTLRAWEKQPDWGGGGSRAGQWGFPFQENPRPKQQKGKPKSGQISECCPCRDKGGYNPPGDSPALPPFPGQLRQSLCATGGPPGARGAGEGLGSAALPSSCSREEDLARRWTPSRGLEGSSDSRARSPAVEGALPERPVQDPAGSAFAACRDLHLMLCRPKALNPPTHP